MPFTFSHPAVVLPFRYIGKQYFSMTGLIVGSVVPDFEYFIRIENRSHFSHTLRGIFWFDIPMAILLSFLFHYLVRPPLIANSPYQLHTRIVKYDQFNWNNYFKKNWVKVLYSILIGILTHIIADKITHKSSNLVSSVPAIMDTQELIDTPKSIYRVIQITFSVIGLALCGLTIWKFPARQVSNDYNPNFRYWLIMAVVAVAALSAIIFRIGYERVDLIVSTISALLAGLVIASLTSLPGRKLIPAKGKLKFDNR